jgi:hypothetical protein
VSSGGCRAALSPFLMRSHRFRGLSVDKKLLSRAKVTSRRASYTLGPDLSRVERSSAV